MTNEDDDEDEGMSDTLSTMLDLLPDGDKKASQALAYLMAGWLIANVSRHEHLMFLNKFNADVLECVQQVMEALEKDVGRERDRV